MRSRLRSFAFVAFPALAGAPLIFTAACGATVATVLSGGDAAPEASTKSPESSPPTDGGAEASYDCVPKGGVCLTGGPIGPPQGTCPYSSQQCWVPLKTGTAPACASDQDCLGEAGDAGLMAPGGTCSLGLCLCKDGASVQANGKCGATSPPACALQGGVCRPKLVGVGASGGVQRVYCNAGELESDESTNTTCSSSADQLCCLPESACKGGGRVAPGGGWTPVGFVCSHMGFDTGYDYAPICVNHWETCRFRDTARALPDGH